MKKMRHVYEPRKLPEVLSVEEVTRLLQSAGSRKYQAALGVAYGAGLRASEVVHLKVPDIDNERMVLHVEQGKGKKDRYAARLVAPGPGAAQTAPRRLAVSGPESGEPDVHPAVESGVSLGAPRRRDRQARVAP